jgi:hypothetical protein
MKKTKLKIITEQFWDIENKYNLIEKQINNVYYWRLIRKDIYNEILKQNNVIGTAIPITFNSLYSKIIEIPKIIFNQEMHGAIKRNSKKEILIFENLRKKKIDNEYKCLYTYFISKYLKNFELIEKAYQKKHYEKPSLIRSYEDHFSFYDFFIERIISFRYTSKEIKFINQIESEINITFRTNLNLKKIIKNRINIFKYNFRYYDRLLKKRKPKKVIITVSSNAYEPLIAACKDQNVESIEIQHGLISNYDLGLTFNKKEKIPYFPDKMWLFGKYWFDSTSIPLKEKDVKYIGYPYMEDRLNKFKNLKKNKKQVLFISFGAIGKELSKIACEFNKLTNEYKIIYKLHPGEYERWQKEYPWLLEAQKDGLKIIDNNEIDFYELLAKSEFTIGVNSTGLFEGIMLNCKTILVQLPRIESMDYLIKQYKVPLIRNNRELLKKLKKYNLKKIKNKEYFFAKPDYDEMFKHFN